MKKLKDSCLIVALATLFSLFGCGSKEEQVDNTYLEYALKTANWLDAQKIVKPEGIIWRSSNEQENHPIVNSNLYKGSAGIILFYIELYHQTGDRKYLEDALSGADYLLTAVPDSVYQYLPFGLYVGSSGIGLALSAAYNASQDPKYLDEVKKNIEALDKYKIEDQSGYNWGSNTDIISGNSGIGLYLLYIYKEHKIDKALELAEGVGKSLISMAKDTVGGKKWMMDPSFPRYMPNFSHGTAGTAYFLAVLYEQTKNPLYKTAALEGTNHLLRIANEDGLIYHHDPDTTNLVYYGWCHGPVGTGRLYQKLSVIEGNSKWADILKTANLTMIEENLTETHPEGFWQNVGQCCGSAGIADYFLSLYQTTSDPKYLQMSSEMTDDIINHMSVEGSGIKWIHAENRTQPENLKAQTGYMQGASGIGLHFLRLHAFLNQKSISVRFPDSPF